MPLPLLLGIGAAVAGVTGVGVGIHGAVKMKQANDTLKLAEATHKENIDHFEKQSKSTAKTMDKLGRFELEVLKSFETFSDSIEKIQNRPEFVPFTRDGVTLPKYNREELCNVSVGAGVLLGGLGGAALGTAGGFAAAGATTSAVMALGTASTGTAIASLSGAAATNATLAALGGGSLVAGGGGIALGTTMLGAATLGVGLLVGGIIFNFTGEKLSNKADISWEQMKTAESTINKICSYLVELQTTAGHYKQLLSKVYEKYQSVFSVVDNAVNVLGKTDWDDLTEQEKLSTQNAVLLVSLLYKMCQIQLVMKSENNSMNTINKIAINEATNSAKTILSSLN